MKKKRGDSVRVGENHFITAETHWTNTRRGPSQICLWKAFCFCQDDGSWKHRLVIRLQPATSDGTRRRISSTADQSKRLRSRKKNAEELKEEGEKRRGGGSKGRRDGTV